MKKFFNPVATLLSFNSIRQGSKKIRVATAWVTTQTRVAAGKIFGSRPEVAVITQNFSGYNPGPTATPNTSLYSEKKPFGSITISFKVIIKNQNKICLENFENI